jgi:hypothetical protein
MKKIISSLVLLALSASSMATGLEYRHGELLNFGRFELRMRMVRGSGVVNCFCLFRKGPMSESEWMEYDIEILGSMQNCIETTAHVFNNYTWSERNYLYQLQCFDYNLTDDYHTFGCEWAPDHVTWEVDGNILRKAEKLKNGMISDISYSSSWDGSTTRETEYELDWLAKWAEGGMMCAFDCWNGCDASWCGDWDGAACESPLIYSWFKYYSYTPGTGHNGSDFTLSDWDDFDEGWDESRWKFYGPMDQMDGKAVANICGGGVGNIPDDPGDVDPSQPSVYANRNSLKSNGPVKAISYANNTITFNLGSASDVKLALYNMNGKLVNVISSGYMKAGDHSVSIDKSISAGAYAIALSTPVSREVKRVITVSK